MYVQEDIRSDDWLVRLDPRHARRQPAPSETEIVPARESFEHLDEPVADTRCYRLLLRFGLVNLVALALLGSAAVQGWIATVLVADKTHLSIAICAVFVAGLGLCARKVWQTSIELNEARAGEAARGSLVMRYVTAVQGRTAGARAIAAGALRSKLASRIAVVRQIAGSLVLLGLIGTVIGFIIALSGVDSTTAADVNSVGLMVSALIEGMSVALYTTLTGAVLNIWLMVNFNLLARGNIKLHAAIVSRGEQYGRV